jgi:flagellar biosynthesis protein FlhG
MNDQALKLREIASNFARKKSVKSKKRKKTRCIAVASGKGGVGKSNIALNSALVLSKAGFKTLLIDGDINLGNLDILLGSSPKYNLSNMFVDKLPIERVIHKGPDGLHILSGCSGEKNLIGIEHIFKDFVIDSLIKIESQYDYIIIDTAAGIDSYVVDFLVCADEIVVVVTSEPTSVLDSYALIKVLMMRRIYGKINIMVNLASSVKDAKGTFRKLGIAVKRFLDYKIHYLGFLPSDKSIIKAVKNQVPVVISDPDNKISKLLKSALSEIVANNDKKYIENELDSSYFSKLKSIIIKKRVN